MGALVLLSVFAYGPSLGWTYLADDYTLISSATSWKGGPNWELLERAFFERLDPAKDARFYRPLWRASFALDGMSGANAALSHGVAVGLFALLVCLVYVLGRELGLPRRTAWVGAAFLALSPVPIEAVTWVSSRGDLLALSAMCGAWVLGLRAARRNRALGARLGIAGCTLVAFLSKEPGVLLGPGLFLLLVLGARAAGAGWGTALVGGLRHTAWLAVATVAFLAWRTYIVRALVGGYSTHQGYESFGSFVENKLRTTLAFGFPLGDPVLEGLGDPLAVAVVLAVLAAAAVRLRSQAFVGALGLTLLGFAPLFEIDIASWRYPGTRHYLLPSIGWALVLAQLVGCARRPAMFWALALALLVSAGLVQRQRFEPYAEASDAMTALRAELEERFSADPSAALLLHNLPERYGPAVCALNAFPSAAGPPFRAERAPRDVVYLLDSNVRHGHVDLMLMRLLLNRELEQLAWSRKEQRLVPRPFRFGVLVLKGAWEPGEEPGTLSVGGVRVEGIAGLERFEIARGDFVEVRLAAGSVEPGWTYDVVDLRPSQPAFLEPRTPDERYRLRDGLDSRGAGLLLGDAVAIEPFSLGGALLVRDPKMVTCVRDPDSGLWTVPPERRGVLESARFAQAFYRTPEGIAFSERTELPR